MRRIYPLILALAAGIAICGCSSTKGLSGPGPLISDESTIVQTTNGKVQGYLDGDIYTFRGIPYAQAERFMPPQSPKPYEGVRVCRTYGPKAPQGSSMRFRHVSSDYDFAFQFNLEPMDEKECLVLNVWTQGLNDGKKRPVYVWIHGGLYVSGSGSDLPCYEGKSLAHKGDIVAITINHRLNVLGYTDLRCLGGKYSESVNLGMQDIVKALEWVHENIAAFGGDPGNVTIGGQSGGGGKVATLMAMPSARGLFHKAIVQSGSKIPYTDGESSYKLGQYFVEELGISADNAADIEKFTYEELSAASRRASMKMPLGFGGAQCPSVDGKYLIEDPVAPALSKDIPLLIGTNLYEFYYRQATPETTMEQARQALTARFGGDSAKADTFIREYSEAYPDMIPRDLVSTDMYFRPGAIDQAKKKSAQGGAPVFNYLFVWRPEGSDTGPCHGMELPFMTANIALQREMTRATKEAYDLSDRISSAWIQFFRTGNPSTKGMPKWEPYTEESGATMIFDNVCRLRHHHDEALLKYESSSMF